MYVASHEIDEDVAFGGPEGKLTLMHWRTYSGDSFALEQEMISQLTVDSGEQRRTHKNSDSDFTLLDAVEFFDKEFLLMSDSHPQSLLSNKQAVSDLAAGSTSTSPVSPETTPGVAHVGGMQSSEQEPYNKKQGDRFQRASKRGKTLHPSEAKSLMPQTTDVLFGRGKNNREHPGNQRMKVHIENHRRVYNRSGRNAKTEITKKIVKILQSEGARFLRQTRNSHLWEEVPDNVAREKVGHAMRDGTRNADSKQARKSQDVH